MFRWKTWAVIPLMFHEENIVFQTCRAAVFRRKVGLTVVLRWSYGGPMIQVTEKRLELSAYEGTKKARETSDMVMGLPTENTKGTKIKMYMKLDDKSQQITQISQIIIDKRKSSNETNETNNSCNSCNSLTIKETAEYAEMRRKRFVFFVKSVGKKKSLLKHKLIINLKNIKV